jgi:hypothetical protein
VGVGGRGKYPGAPPHKKEKRGKKPTARYQYGEKGKAIKKKKKKQQTARVDKVIWFFLLP